jgi:hypothetical protein
MAGLVYARSQGRVGGPPTVMTPERVRTAVLLHGAGQDKSQICRTLGVSRMVVSCSLAKVGLVS